MKIKISNNRIITFLFCLFVLSWMSCKKDHLSASENIQKGDSTIEINVSYPQGVSMSNILQVRYNKVIASPISVTIAFHLSGGDEKNIDITIPSGYKNLQSWGGDNYINSLNYIASYDSVSHTYTSTPINTDWNVQSVEIKSVKCTDAKYGFKVLGGSDSWTFYHPTDAKTSISFISNKDTVSYADYAFNNLFQMHYITASSLYSFIYYSGKTLLISENAAFPISQGMILLIPLFAYYWNGHSAGSVPDQGNTASNGSTLKMTITSVTGTNFSASFSGKIWSDRQKDTLFISNGEIKNASLPTKE